MTTLADRIRAALDETERVARAVTAEGWDEDVAKAEGWNEYHSEVREHIALHDPERELRMVAAHRKILDLHAPGVTLTRVTDGGTVTSCMSCGGWHTMKTGTEWPCDTLLALAEAYGVAA